MSGSTFSSQTGSADVKQKVAVALVVTGAAAGAAYLGYRVYKYRSSEAKDPTSSPRQRERDAPTSPASTERAENVITVPNQPARLHVSPPVPVHGGGNRSVSEMGTYETRGSAAPATAKTVDHFLQDSSDSVASDHIMSFSPRRQTVHHTSPVLAEDSPVRKMRSESIQMKPSCRALSRVRSSMTQRSASVQESSHPNQNDGEARQWQSFDEEQITTGDGMYVPSDKPTKVMISPKKEAVGKRSVGLKRNNAISLCDSKLKTKLSQRAISLDERGLQNRIKEVDTTPRWRSLDAAGMRQHLPDTNVASFPREASPLTGAQDLPTVDTVMATATTEAPQQPPQQMTSPDDQRVHIDIRENYAQYLSNSEAVAKLEESPRRTAHKLGKTGRAMSMAVAGSSSEAIVKPGITKRHSVLGTQLDHSEMQLLAAPRIPLHKSASLEETLCSVEDDTEEPAEKPMTEDGQTRRDSSTSKLAWKSVDEADIAQTNPDLIVHDKDSARDQRANEAATFEYARRLSDVSTRSVSMDESKMMELIPGSNTLKWKSFDETNLEGPVEAEQASALCGDVFVVPVASDNNATALLDTASRRQRLSNPNIRISKPSDSDSDVSALFSPDELMEITFSPASPRAAGSVAPPPSPANVQTPRDTIHTFSQAPLDESVEEEENGADDETQTRTKMAMTSTSQIVPSSSLLKCPKSAFASQRASSMEEPSVLLTSRVQIASWKSFDESAVTSYQEITSECTSTTKYQVAPSAVVKECRLVGQGDAAADPPHVPVPPSSDRATEPIGTVQSGSTIVESDESSLVIADDHFKHEADPAPEQEHSTAKSDESNIPQVGDVTESTHDVTKPDDDSGRESNDSFETNESDNGIVVIGHKSESHQLPSDSEPSKDVLQESTLSFDGSVISDKQADEAKQDCDVTDVPPKTEENHDVVCDSKTETKEDETAAPKSEEKQPEVKSEAPPSDSGKKEEQKVEKKAAPEKAADVPTDSSASSEKKSQPPPVAPKPTVKKPPTQEEKEGDVKSPAAAKPETHDADDDNGIVVIERTTQAESLKAAPPAAKPASPSSTQEPISFDGSIITHEKADVAKLDWAAQCEEADDAKEEGAKGEKSKDVKATHKDERVREKKPTQLPKSTHKSDHPVENKKIPEPKKVAQLKATAPPPPPPSPSNEEDNKFSKDGKSLSPRR